jgi:dipeptidyl aminopeptidase/acylaminoacyl peptidase
MPLHPTAPFDPLESSLLQRAARAWWRWAAAGGLVAIAGAGFTVWRLPSPPASRQPDASLVVASTPPGAAIEVDGRLHGHTPAHLWISAGDRRVTLRREGYANATYKVQVEPGQTARLEAELWLQTPIAQRLRPTLPGTTITDARFLADGRLAFTVALPGDERQLWVHDERGGSRRLGPADARSSLAVAPDGAHVAYLARGTGAELSDGRLDELWIAQPDNESGDRRYVLPSTAERLVDLSWAPPGQQLLVVSRGQRPNGSVRTRLRWLDLAGGEPHELLSLPGEIVPSSYTWSPDGTQVALLTRTGQLTSLGVVDVKTAEFHYLADLSREDSTPLTFAPIAWSPDGRQLVYAAPAEGPAAPTLWPFGPKPPPALFTAEANAGTGQRLATATGQSPAWRRDGLIVALARPNGNGPLVLRVVAPDGETRDQGPLPLEPANTFAARWDVASAQAIVVVRSTNAFGASQTDYQRVRFRAEVER